MGWFESMIVNEALWLTTLNAFAHELGLPIPLSPFVIWAGVQASQGHVRPELIVLAVTLATVLGNSLWYFAGRYYGDQVMRLLCRFSRSPSACAARGETQFARFGLWALVPGRFIPGVSLVAPPLAGATGVPFVRFLVLDAVGALAWSATFVGIGYGAHAQWAAWGLW